jgi:3-deoxy-manno-octulosonate cytidylyltransferase (CMP-KDO synthetase)
MHQQFGQIPARMPSTRLPGKPLADIHGLPMIVQVWKRAMEAKVGPFWSPRPSRRSSRRVEKAGGQAVLTDPNHPSGSDRIAEAVKRADPAGRYDVVVNVQGDLPTIDPRSSATRCCRWPIRRSTSPRWPPRSARGGAHQPQRGQGRGRFRPGSRVARALYFSRATCPARDGPHYHHIGLYAYRRAALDPLRGAAPACWRPREPGAAARAGERHAHRRGVLVDTVPLGVDTPADLERARQMLAPR